MSIERPRPLVAFLCASTVGFGVVSVLGAHAATDAPWRMLFDVLRSPTDGLSTEFDRMDRILNAVLGGVMFGWGVMLTRILAWPAPTVRHAIREGVVAWWVVDSLGSIVAGLPANVVLNTVFAAGFLVALRQGTMTAVDAPLAARATA